MISMLVNKLVTSLFVKTVNKLIFMLGKVYEGGKGGTGGRRWKGLGATLPQTN